MTALFRLFADDDKKRVFWALFSLTLLVMLIGIGMRSPWPADEPRFVEVAREMVMGGEWLFPTRGGEFYPDKPPVFMWAIAAVYWLIGDLKLAFLIPNALCGLLTVMLVYDLGCRLWNVRVGRNAALLLLLVPQFLMQAKNAQIDAMVACWITLGCYGLVRHFVLGPHWRWFFASWAFMGLGVITKGVGFLPLLMLLPLAWYRWQMVTGRALLPHQAWSWKVVLGPLAMLGVIALWLVPMLLAVLLDATPEHQAYMNNILFKQTGERYVNAWHHIKPWYFFIFSVIPWLWFPLPLLAIAHGKRVIERIKQDPVIAILLLWVLLVVVFFSLSPGKRNVYILPALPMACLAMAAIIDGEQPRRWFEGLVKGVLWVLGAVLLLAGVLALMHHPKLAARLADYTDDLTGIGMMLLALGGVWLACLWWLRKQISLLNAGAVTLVGWLLVGTWGYMLLDSMRTPQQLMQHTAETIGEDAELGLIKFKEQFILFSPVSVTHFSYLASVEEQERNAWAWMNEGMTEGASAPKRYLLVPEGTTLSCFDMSRGRSMGIAHRDNWLLLDDQAMAASCDAPKRVYRYHTDHPGHWLTD
ncbi:ArnT family glycosyltransferase [Shewanella zhangzhouensis]|uniref:ArnT family glycosyltransferase n=1 Tax=Shewanella zhangzhouensis TaxID=2864213 RepID=UPI001C65FF4F|nr:glycosyltransferase family 39 protein [Shewanella zhangzhouensis]QYK05388.1 glycosyltransferase family 39 protein [Shewanella zhangzhouensis]